jgi:hypothetical protein
MRMTMNFALVAALALTGSAQAGDFGVYATAGTIGIGGGVAATFGSHFGARIGYAKYEHDVNDIEESELKFDGTVEIGGGHALLDWHPFGGSFRLSAGAVQSATLTAHAEPIANTYTLNGVTYSADDIGTATGTAKYESIAPYAGFGFGRALSPDGRFALSADFGVAFTGTPALELNATCSVPNAMLCTQIEGDLAAEEAELQKDADKLKYWPALSVGVSYRF